MCMPETFKLSVLCFLVLTDVGGAVQLMGIIRLLVDPENMLGTTNVRVYLYIYIFKSAGNLVCYAGLCRIYYYVIIPGHATWDTCYVSRLTGWYAEHSWP